MEDLDLFRRKLSDLSLNFTVYCELFDDSEAVSAMNQFHAFVFGNYQKCLVDALYLEFAKLLDPKGKSSNKNLSFAYIVSLVKSDFQTELLSDLAELNTLFDNSNLKLYRNKLLAHNDLKTLCGNPALELDITGPKLEAMLTSAWALFGKVEHYLGVTDRMYQTSAYIQLPTGASIDEFVEKLKNRT